jgi:hypothetical protein
MMPDEAPECRECGCNLEDDICPGCTVEEKKEEIQEKLESIKNLFMEIREVDEDLSDKLETIILDELEEDDVYNIWDTVKEKFEEDC